MRAGGVMIIVGPSILTACAGIKGPPAATADARGPSHAVARDTGPGDVWVSPADTRILSVLHANNQELVRLGQLAAERAVSEDVRRFGEMLIREHSESDMEVQRAAEVVGVTLMRPRDTREMLAREKGESMVFDVGRELGALKGPAFDQTFARRMVEGHRETLRVLERARPDAESAEVGAIADRTLRSLREHLRGAAALAGR
jgi:putative membrane protein